MDDNATAREILKGTLASFGFRVSLAANGEEGLKELETAPKAHDLVLMDWKMPVMDGYEATRRIRMWEWERRKAENELVAHSSQLIAEDPSSPDGFAAASRGQKSDLKSEIRNPKSKAFP